MSAQNHMHQSKVSRRLDAVTAQEVCELIYLPRLKDFSQHFPFITAINQAHVLMLNQQGLIPAKAAQSIAKALIEMESEGPAVIDLDPQREDAYFNYEARLIDKTGIDTGGRMHTARSRNDILATMDRMRCREVVNAIMEALSRVRAAALNAAASNLDVVMPGYTHLQPAQPMTYGFYLAGVAEALGRDADRLSNAYTRIDQSPLGAGAFAGTSYAIDRSETAKLLGFPTVIDSSLDSVASRDFLFEVLGTLSLLAATWSRVAQDYFLWTTDEFNLFEFPDSVAGTSSIMPQKKNPVVLEYLKGRAGHVLGSYTAAITILRTTNFTHSGDANRESIGGFWATAQDCLASLKLLELVVSSAKPRKGPMLKRARENFSSATDLADVIVTKGGVSFRQAHHIVGAVVREALDGGMTADQITLEMVQRACLDQLGHAISLSQEDLTASLDPSLSVESRDNGGPSSKSVRNVLTRAHASLEKHDAEIRARKLAIVEADNERRLKIAELAG